MLKPLVIVSLMMLLSSAVYAHAGPHGNDECLVHVGDTDLRLSGYQFKGTNPDRHYCRHFPHLTRIIIKIDSLTADLSKKSIQLQLLKRQSWLGLLFNSDNAFSVIKQQGIQSFSNQVVSIDAEIEDIDIYAIKLRLIDGNGAFTEQRFVFLVGVPFAQIMVSISGLLLMLLVFIVMKQSRSKRQQQTFDKT